MNEAALYRRNNGQTRRDAKLILEQYGSLLQWRNDGGDTLIDIGTGSGDVFMDFIYSLMPPSFKETVGSDVSANMLNYARQCYSEYERVKFQILDIGAEHMPKQMIGRFDHVTSFYCLHWIQDLSKALGNIYQLLRSSGGDCLLVFLSKSIVFDVYKSMAVLPKWSEYMQDYEHFISLFQHSSDPAAEFTELLKQSGFVDYQVEIRNEFFIYNTSMFRGKIRAVCPFFERIPTALHEEFLDDFNNIVANMNVRQRMKNSKDFEYIYKYSFLVAYARKPDGMLKSILPQFERKKSTN